ncbi:MAG: hypothetical protein ACREJ5_28520 [Geminicoccaceae bacterium]
MKPRPSPSRRLDQLGIGLDPGEILLAGRDLARRQAVDPLDLVGARCDLEAAPRLQPVRIADHQLGVARGIAIEAEHEPPVLRDAQLPAVQPHGAAGRDLAAHQAALDQLALEVQLRRLGSEQNAKAADQRPRRATPPHPWSPQPVCRLPHSGLREG